MITLALISGLLNILLALWVWSLIQRILTDREIIDYQRDALERGEEQQSAYVRELMGGRHEL